MENLLLDSGFTDLSLGSYFKIGGGGWNVIGISNNWIMEGDITAEVFRMRTSEGKYTLIAKILKLGVSRLLIDQRKDDFYPLRGKKLTFAVYVRSTIPGIVRIGIEDDKSQSYSEYHTGNGQWEILTVTHTVSPDANRPVYFVIIGGDKGITGRFDIGESFLTETESVPSEPVPALQVETAAIIVQEVIAEQKIEPTVENVQAVVVETVKAVEEAIKTETPIVEVEPVPVTPVPDIKPVDLTQLVSSSNELIEAGATVKEATEFVVNAAFPPSKIDEMAKDVEALKASGMSEEDAVSRVVTGSVRWSKYIPWAVGIGIVGTITAIVLKKKKA